MRIGMQGARFCSLVICAFLLFPSFGFFAPYARGDTRSYNLYHTYDQMTEELRSIAENHSNIVSLFDIGKTWENRTIWAVKISDNAGVNESSEPKVLFVGGHHAREFASVEVPLYTIEYLSENYGRATEATKAVDECEIWVVPMLNPDGHVIVEGGMDWRKNRRPMDTNSDGIVDTYGVDLNRNYDFERGADGTYTSADPGNEAYYGPYAFSEPETAALRDLVAAQNFSMSISYHGFSEQVLSPWSYTYNSTNDSALIKIGDNIANLTGYTSSQASDMYVTHGDFVDWFYNRTRAPSYTIEVGKSFRPQDSDLLGILDGQLSAALYAVGIAPNPSRVLLPEWTVIVYMDADNDLNQFALDDLNEMESVGSSESLNIIALYDGSDYGDSRIYYIGKDPNGTDPTVVSAVIYNESTISNSTLEAGMTDPETLESFVKFAIASYPAQHYMLSMWDHGTSLFGLPFGEDWHNPGDTSRVYGSGLSLPQISTVLGNVTSQSQRKLDIIGFDACYLGFFETYYMLGNYSHYALGAEDVEPDGGWDYTSLSAVESAPLITPAELAARFVADYDDMYKSSFRYDKFSDNYTLCAIDLYSLRRFFTPVLNALASELYNYSYGYKAELSAVRTSVQTYRNGPTSSTSAYNADLFHLCELIYDEQSLPLPIRSAAKRVMENYSTVVFANSNSSYDNNAHGPSIYFPRYSYDAEYDEFEFAYEFWDDFIRMYLDPKDVMKPEITHMPFAGTLSAHTYNATAAISDESLNASAVYLWYSLNQSAFNRISMAQSGDDPGVYWALIPAQGNNTSVRYYIEASDASGNTALLPENASQNNSASLFSFTVIIDTTPPAISHTPIWRVGAGNAFYPIVANISDDIGLDEASAGVFFRPSGASNYTRVQMTNYGNGTFAAKLPRQAPGTYLEYYIEAEDGAQTPNAATYPAAGQYVRLNITSGAAVLSAAISYNYTFGQKDIEFFANCSNASGQMVCLWNFADGEFGTGQAITHTYASNGRRNITLSVISSNGEASGAAASVFIGDVPIIFSLPPSILAEEGEVLTFDGAQSVDSDGFIVNWTWNFGDGAVLYGPAASHAYPLYGRYVANLSVTDDSGLHAYSIVNITINCAPIPIISAPQAANAGDEVLFDASGSIDRDGRILYYIWDFGDGTYAYARDVSHTYQAGGNYSVNLTVVDDSGSRNETGQPIFVNVKPAAAIGALPSSYNEGDTVYFTGSQSIDSDGEVVNWSWDFGDGGALAYTTNTSHAYSLPGAWAARLTVTDDFGASAQATVRVYINRRPVSYVDTAFAGYVGDSISLYGRGIDSDGRVVAYRWDFGDGSIREWNASAYANHTYSLVNNYTARFQVMDNNSAESAWAAASVSVRNAKPVARINVSAAAGRAGAAIAFSAAASYDPGGRIVYYNWTFDDGARLFGAEVSHAFSSPGNHTILLKVTDDNGTTDEAAAYVVIGSSESVPVFIPSFGGGLSAFAMAFAVLFEYSRKKAGGKRR